MELLDMSETNRMLSARVLIPKSRSLVSLPQALAEAKSSTMMKRAQSSESLYQQQQAYKPSKQSMLQELPNSIIRTIHVPSFAHTTNVTGSSTRRSSLCTARRKKARRQRRSRGRSSTRASPPPPPSIPKTTSLLESLARNEPVPKWITIDTTSVNKLALVSEITERDRIHHNHQDLMPLSDLAMILSNRTACAISKGLFDQKKKFKKAAGGVGEVGTNSTVTSASTIVSATNHSGHSSGSYFLNQEFDAESNHARYHGIQF